MRRGPAPQPERRTGSAAAPPLDGARARARRSASSATGGARRCRRRQPVRAAAPWRGRRLPSDDAGKPRRTGWWAKRLLGGEKAKASVMQSRWVDRDAQAAVDRYAAAGIAPTWRCASTPRGCSARDPQLVLHGGGNTSVKTRMPRSRRRRGRGAVRQGLRLRTWRRSSRAGLPAVRLAPLRKLRTRDDALRRGHGARAARQSDRPGGAQPVGRTAAARLHAARSSSTTPMRPRC